MEPEFASTKKTTKPDTKSKTTSKIKTVNNKPPKKVLEFRNRLLKEIIGKELITEAHMITTMNACILLESLPQQNSGAEMMKSLQPLFDLPFKVNNYSAFNRDTTISKLYVLPDGELNEIITYCTCVIAASGENNFDLSQVDKSVETIVKIIKPELADHFTMDKTFLECHQKTGMIALLKDSGFGRWLDEKESKTDSFTKLCKGTVKVLLETFTKSDFPIAGFVPKSLHYKDYAKTNSASNTDK